MESAPQSTIAHIAVIEPASEAGVVPRHHREERGGRIKRRPALPKGRPQIGGTMPKSYPRRNVAAGKNRRFRQVFTRKIAACAGIPGNSRNGCRRGAEA